jgi:hypothetical protein
MSYEISSELLASLFESQEIKGLTAPRLYRIENGIERWYQSEDGRQYLGSTSFISLTALARENKYLDTWRQNLAIELGSTDAVDTYVGETAKYGTVLHIAMAEAIKAGGVDWTSFGEWANGELLAQGFRASMTKPAIADLKRDMAAIMQFFADKQGIEFLAVELPVVSEKWGLATQIDLVCRFDGQIWALNLKSGRSGFYPSHKRQMWVEHECLKETFPQLGAIRCANLAPKAWRKVPSYNFEEADIKAIDREMRIKHALAEEKGAFELLTYSRINFEGFTALRQSPLPNISKI